LNHRHWLLAAALSTGATSCNGPNSTPPSEDTGGIELAITNAPADAACLEVTVAGSRTVSKSFGLTPGQTTANLSFKGLPLGIATVNGEAFTTACSAVSADAVPSYLAEAPVSVRIDVSDVVEVILKLIRNGRLLVDVDFETGVQPHNVPVLAGAIVKPLLTVGDSVNLKPDGTPYRLVGIPDGTGAYDNGNGTFTWLVNHELGAGDGIARAHGGKGAFVSRWIVRKSDLTVLYGEDLIKTVYHWDTATSAYAIPAVPPTFGRFCAAELAPISAFHDAATSTGFNGYLFLNGEEAGDEGKGYAHGVDGVSYDLPRLGKFSWENSVANPKAQPKTIVAGFDDSPPGQLYIYVGTKTKAGKNVDRAGLTNGNLFGVKVTGFPAEIAASGIPTGTAFTLHAFGNVEGTTGAALQAASNAAGVTNFLRPEDGGWDASNPNDLYFVTTASFTGFSRLWRLRFTDIANPEAGGTIDLLLDGTEGGKMFDNMSVNSKGQIHLQEDVGGQDHLGKTWRYDIATDKLTLILQANPALFTPGAPGFLTRDEEASGVVDAKDILGAGWFLAVNQAHYNIGDVELVQGGQLFAFFDPGAR
jgi:hypothetical protein